MKQNRIEKTIGVTDQSSNQVDLRPQIDKSKQAVALSYDVTDAAPRIIASGKGYLAQKMIDKAKEHEIPLHQDTKLANTLSKLEIGDMIPPELYEVIAEILVFVDRMEKLKDKVNGSK